MTHSVNDSSSRTYSEMNNTTLAQAPPFFNIVGLLVMIDSRSLSGQ